MGCKTARPKQETGNDCDVISGFLSFGPWEKKFPDVFLFSYKQRTFVPFLGELVSLQSKKMTWKSIFPETLKGHSQLAHIRIYASDTIANLHITEIRSILFSTKYDKTL